jgi:heat shock protein HslJ
MIKHLIFAVGSMMILSCSVRDRGADQQDMPLKLNDTWEVLVIDGETLMAETEGRSLPQLEIHSEEMKYTGSDGCNNIMGGIAELDKETIHFGLTAGTRMICLDMEIPDLFNRTLPEVHAWEIKQNRLHLFDADGNERMQLMRAD